MEKGKIYKIVNNVNGLVYVGCTVNSLEHRFYEHIYRCFKTDYKSKLYNSMKKYGLENFTIELIEECDLKIIYDTEKKYIKEYNSYENGLNTTLGGEGCLGYTHSPEIRQKISEKVKNGNSHKGKTYEELYGDKFLEEKQKRSESVKKGWDELSEENRKIRLNNLKNALKKNLKYSDDVINEIKNKFKNGYKVKEVLAEHPDFTTSYLYSLKNNKRRNN